MDITTTILVIGFILFIILSTLAIVRMIIEIIVDYKVEEIKYKQKYIGKTFEYKHILTPMNIVSKYEYRKAICIDALTNKEHRTILTLKDDMGFVKDCYLSEVREVEE